MTANIQVNLPIDELASAIIVHLLPLIKRQDEAIPTTKNKYYSRKETAKKLNISLPTLNTYTKTGLIEAKRIGGRVLFTEESIFNALKTIKTN